jgi:hypothetical protein
MHPPHLGQSTARTPAFSTGGAGHAGDENLVVYGLVHHASGSGLIRWQGDQIGEVMVTALALRARVRAHLSVKAHRPEQCSTHTAMSRLRRHFSLSPNALSDILTLARPFKIGLSATAAMDLCLCCSDFL